MDESMIGEIMLKSYTPLYELFYIGVLELNCLF